MELEDLKTLAAASLLGGSVFSGTNDGGRTHTIISPRAEAITAAVKTAQKIWEEVLAQRDDD